MTGEDVACEGARITTATTTIGKSNGNTNNAATNNNNSNSNNVTGDSKATTAKSKGPKDVDMYDYGSDEDRMKKAGSARSVQAISAILAVPCAILLFVCNKIR